MFRCTLALLTFSFSLAVASGQKNDWPGYRGRNNDGRSVDSGLFLDHGGHTLKIAWKKRIGSGYSGVAVVGERVVTLCSDGEVDVAVAFHTETGERLWRYEIGPIHKGHSGSHDGPISTPIIADGRVFGLAAQGRLFALAAATGKVIWSNDLAKTAKAPYYGFTSSPLVVDGKLIVLVGGENQMVIAFDPASGKRLWASGSDSVEYQSPILWNHKGKTLVLAAGRKNLVAFDPGDGSTVWSWAHGGSHAMGASSLSPVPTLPGRIFLSHQQNACTLISVTGNEVHQDWESKVLRNSYNIPVLNEGFLYGFSNRVLTCLDESTGKLQWRSRGAGDGFISLVEGHLVITTKKGGLEVAKATPEGYQPVASIDVFAKGSWSPPAIADGHIYIRGFDGLARVDIIGTMTPRTTSVEKKAHALATLIEDVKKSPDKKAVVDIFLEKQTSFPIIEGENLVHFVYRGDARDLVLAGDMFGARQERSMKRIEGTDLFTYSLTVDPGAVLCYRFVKNYGEALLDPRNQRTTHAFMLNSEMDFNYRGEAIPMSWFAMPRWQAPAHLKHKNGAPGSLREHELESKVLKRKLKVKVYLPPGHNKGQDFPVAYVLDELAWEEGAWNKALAQLSGQIEPFIAVFVTLPLWNPRGYNMVRDELLPMIESTYHARSTRESRSIIAMGFSGPAAFQAAFDEPGLFARVATQSCYLMANQVREFTAEAEALARKQGDKVTFYLDWGSYDIRNSEESWDIARHNKSLFEMLKQKGFDVSGKVFADGGDWTGWRARTGFLIEALYGKGG